MISDELKEVDQERELANNIKSRLWRLNNLYYVKNENGLRVLFKLNKIQEYLLNNLWFLNVILKARQLGVTTFICILYLDDAIFNGLDCGFIAHTLDDSKKIFDEKIKYAWDNLPEAIKDLYNVDTDNTRELKFKNKATNAVSSIYVGTSLRSQTYQRIHISELSTIDQRNPMKSEEIKTGTFNTVHKGQIITVESTAKAAYGLFYDICRLAMDNKKLGRLSEMDWKFFFFPWFEDEKYILEGASFNMPKELLDYFDQLDKDGIKLKKEQKNWYYKKWMTQGEAMKSEFPSTPEECFRSVIEGAYYAKETEKAINDGRLRDVPYDSRYPVDTYWDLGTTTTRKDSMSVIFAQNIGAWIHIIDFYGCSGEGFPHMKNILNEKGYTYGTHWAPHDIEVTEIGSGKTRWEMASDLGIRFRTVEKIGFNDGIEAARLIFGRCWFDESKTGGDKNLFGALRNYRKEWDDNLGRFKDKPLKDWTSDPADSFRMLAVSIKDYMSEEEKIYVKEENNKIDILNVFKNF